ncbi:hypothetical protein KC939_00290, partial [Candidatus Saccharibacteria bacterium]|nr:hypothetical protein [Candidatus Saccharibacteria bacterium]
PESFNVLVKELQGLGLKVDLVSENGSASEFDAEDVLSETIKDEADHMPTVEADDATPMDVTEEMVASEFEVLDEDNSGSASTTDDDDDSDDKSDSSTEEKEVA